MCKLLLPAAKRKVMEVMTVNESNMINRIAKNESGSESVIQKEARGKSTKRGKRETILAGRRDTREGRQCEKTVSRPLYAVVFAFICSSACASIRGYLTISDSKIAERCS
jgi:hypothetical protein